MEAQGWELTCSKWKREVRIPGEDSKGCGTSFSSFFKLWIKLCVFHGNYNDTDKSGTFEGWSFIVGDAGGKVECGKVLLFAYLFLERRNGECCLFYTYLRPTNCGTVIACKNVCKSAVLLKHKKECPFICALEIIKVSSFSGDANKIINSTWD